MDDRLRVAKAARLAALLAIDDTVLDGISDIKLGKIIGVHRTNVWRYRQMLPQLRELRDRYLAAIIKAAA